MAQGDRSHEDALAFRSRSNRAIVGLILVGAVVYFLTQRTDFAFAGALLGALLGYFWRQVSDMLE